MHPIENLRALADSVFGLDARTKSAVADANAARRIAEGVDLRMQRVEAKVDKILEILQAYDE
jgi:hypothetical protein